VTGRSQGPTNGARWKKLSIAPVLVGAASFGLSLAGASVTHVSGAGLPGPTAVDHPAGIAFRGSDLIVAVGSSGSLEDISASGTSVLLGGLVPGSFDRGPTGVVVDGHGNAYVAETEDDSVYFVKPGGSSGVYARGLGSPNGLAFNSSGVLYVADQAGRRILAVSPTRQVTVWATGFSTAPFGLAWGPDNALYVSTERDGKVWRATHGSTPTLYATIPPAGGTPSAEGLAFDTAGNLFVGAGATGRVVEIPSGGGTAVDVANNLAGPIHLAFADSSTTLYVATAAEGTGTTKNMVSTVTTTATGRALAAPLLSPSPLPQAPPHGVAFAPGGLGLDPAGFLDQLPQGVATDIGHQAGEPKIEVSNAGNVYFNAAGFNGSTCNPMGVGGFPATVLRESTDGGLTWFDSTPPVNPPCSLDPYEYYDRTTNRFFDVDLEGQCSAVEFTDSDPNPSKTWTNRAACGPAALDDHETVAAGPPAPGQTLMGGYPHAMYYCFQNVSHASCDSSVDGGDAWTPGGIAYNNASDLCGAVATGGNGEQTGHVFVGPDGTVYLPKANCLPGPVIAISHDGGTTWTQVLVHPEAVQAQDHEAAVAIDKAGTIYYDWVSGVDLLPYLALSHDDGAHWSAPISLRAPGMTEADQPDLIAGDAGKIAAYFMGTESDCCYGRTQDGGANQTGTNGDSNSTQPSMWNNYVVISLNASSASPTFVATSFNDPRHPTTRGNCGPGRCSATFDFLGTYIDNGGRLWGSISNACLAACSNVGLTGSNVGDAGEGFAGQLMCGPKLLGSGDITGPAFSSTSIRPQCGQAAPGKGIPEAPSTLLMLLIAAGGAGAVLATRRRIRPRP